MALLVPHQAVFCESFGSVRMGIRLAKRFCSVFVFVGALFFIGDRLYFGKSVFAPDEIPPPPIPAPVLQAGVSAKSAVKTAPCVIAGGCTGKPTESRAKAQVKKTSAVQATGTGTGTCMSSRRNLIIGAAMGYDFKELLPFMRSFVQSGTYEHADVVFIVNSSPSEKLRLGCKRYGCTLFIKGQHFKDTDVLVKHGFDAGHAIQAHSACFRYVLYDEVVATYPGCYDKVIIADTRDLFFQRDPFPFIVDGLYVSQEQVNIADPECCEFGEKGFYGKWNRQVVDCAKKGASDLIIKSSPKHEHTPIICSGVTLGTAKAMKGYLKAMLDFYKKGLDSYCHGVDQGVHMLLLSTPGKIPGKITYMSNEEGPVFNNVCYNPAKKTPTMVTQAHEQDPLLKLRNGNRTMIAAIVHQYDRCGYLASKIKWGLPDVEDVEALKVKAAREMQG